VSPTILKAFYQIMLKSQDMPQFHMTLIDSILEKNFTEDEMVNIIENVKDQYTLKFIYENYKATSAKVTKLVLIKNPQYMNFVTDAEVETLCTTQELLSMIRQQKLSNEE